MTHWMTGRRSRCRSTASTARHLTLFPARQRKRSFAKLMELIIFIAALCVVGVLATRFGYDSRPTAHSKEEDLASLGLSRDQAGTTLSDNRCEAARLRSDHSNNR